MIKLTSINEKKSNPYYDGVKNIDNNIYPKIDLTSNIWVINHDKVIIDNYILVDESVEMRLDTISKYMLGSEDYVDVILKFNNILNPFTIKKGDVILIPNLNSFFDNISRMNYKPKNIISVSDKNKNKNGSKSPSVKKSGKGNKSYKKNNGIIIF